MRRAAFLLITATALALMASSARAMILITADRGGLITDYAERFLSARATGEQVVIDGACLSACTLAPPPKPCSGSTRLGCRREIAAGSTACPPVGR